MDGHKGDFILCPMLCIALHWTDNKQHKIIRTEYQVRDTKKLEFF